MEGRPNSGSYTQLTWRRRVTGPLRVFVFPLNSRAKAQYIRRVSDYRPGAPAGDRPLIEDGWTLQAGVGGSDRVRVARNDEDHWDYYTVFYILPVQPVSSGNIAIHSIGTCPSFAGELIVMRRSEDGSQMLDMRLADTQKAYLAVTMVVHKLMGFQGPHADPAMRFSMLH